jgi:branched-chain amino acid transport system permease protein
MNSSPQVMAAATADARGIGWVAPMIGMVLVLMVCAVFTDGYVNLLLRLAAVNVVVVCALNLLLGYGGQAFLAVAATFAIGAYTSSLAVMKLGLPWLVALAFGGVLAAVFGLLTSLPALRLSGAYLAMVSIAFNVIVEEILIHWQELTGGPVGLPGIPRGGPFGFTLNDQWMASFMGIAAVLSWWAVDRIRHAPWGQTIVAVRESEIAARSLGVDTTRVKAVTFAVANFIMGLGGALYAHSAQYISPDVGGVFGSILFVLMLILGGSGTLWGPVIGALILTLLPQFLTDFQKFHVFVLGLILLACITLRPKGLASLFSRQRYPQSGLPAGGSVGASKVTLASLLGHPTPKDHGALEVRAVSRRFGGIVALTKVSFELCPGTIHGLIGPNGAGKSTLVNVLTGHYRPTDGAVVFRGQSLSRLSMSSIARLGIVRTFQKPQLFSDLSVIENLEIAQFAGLRHSLVGGLLGLPNARVKSALARSRALEFASAVGLAEWLYHPAGSLAQGQQRLLEIGRALAAQPRVLVLDEPAAGLSASEINDLVVVLRQVRSAGISVLLIEHHMNLVMTVCDRITVIDQGEHLLTGSPAEIRSSEAVREAYLGTSHEHHG